MVLSRNSLAPVLLMDTCQSRSFATNGTSAAGF
jgi:hypothetical protein